MGEGCDRHNPSYRTVQHKWYSVASWDFVTASHLKMQHLGPIHWTDELHLMTDSTSTST